ncbi:MAG: adenine phosphoribosyltransferase, partial [Kiritimatiellae bacterium]|nr:adenine phosphoribosyltransferase [Kiritimatiellia bacterium]
AYQTKYSESCMEAQKDAFRPDDRVLLVDDIIATGGSLIAARNVVEKCGGHCTHALAIGRIRGLSGVETLRQNGISATCLLEM